MHPSHPSEADVLVIGAGVAGLLCALQAAEAGLNVAVAFKTTHAKACNTAYAQGGIAASLSWNADDSPGQHIQDTLDAGAGHCNPATVARILGEGETAIKTLIKYGVPFDRGADGQLALTREAAHRVPRILHVNGDQTGIGILRVLIEHAKAHPKIQALPHHQLVNLHTHAGAIHGATLYHHEADALIQVSSPHVVLASGGYAGIYPDTTNPSSSRGDVFALAAQAGARLKHLHLVQFHPTGFKKAGHIHFLVSEALRGEGGKLLNVKGEAFAKRYHPDGELAPRDVVARANEAEIQTGGHPCVYLDMRHFEAAYLKHRFPGIFQMALDHGVNMAEAPLPVAPAAHYCMGGVEAAPEGCTALPGLYAIGEAASTGLHGANRLASNSLLECAVMALLVQPHLKAKPRVSVALARPPEVMTLEAETLVALAHYQAALSELMQEKLGLNRTLEDLTQGLATAQKIQRQISACCPSGFHLELLEATATASLVVQAFEHALAMPYSAGAHFLKRCEPKADDVAKLPENSTA